MSQRPALVVLESKDPAARGKVYPLDSKPAYILGRGHEVDIPVLDPKCSREHAKVEKRPDGSLARHDLGRRQSGEAGDSWTFVPSISNVRPRGSHN